MSITVLDSTGATKTVKTLPAQGAALASASLPVGISTDQLSQLASASNQSSELTKLDQLHADLIAPTPAGTFVMGKVGFDQTTQGVTNGVVMISTSGAAVTMQNPSSDTSISNLNSLNTNSYGASFNGSTWTRNKMPSSTARLVTSAATTNATLVKSGVTLMSVISVYNASASLKFLKFYNKATAAVPGTDTPVITIALAPNATTQMTYVNGGHYFALGLSYANTGAAVDTDTTAVAAGDIIALNISYA